MKLSGFRESTTYSRKFDNLDPNQQNRVNSTRKKLVRSIIDAKTPADIPQPLNRPSNTKPFRRSQVDRDIRIYWWIDENRVLVFHDICNHKQAREYLDVR